jgi:8-oxo-dGTP pyrophosphatase MutT (NUDIX family)
MASGAVPADIATLIERFPSESPGTERAGAAVLIVLREGAQDIETLLIERAMRPGDRASGQIALPGGHVQPADQTLTDTALRECQEEVGLQRADLRGAPRFVGIETAQAFSMEVAVLAAELGAPASGPSVHSPGEVASIFWLPRSALARSDRVMRVTYRGPLEVPAVMYLDHVLWGFTRRLLLKFFGFPADPDDDRVVREPAGSPDLDSAPRTG